MHTTKLDAPLGAYLHLETDSLLDERDREKLRRLYAEHGLLIVRDGELSDERQIDLLSCLGRIEPDECAQPMRMEVTNQHDQTSAPAGKIAFHYDYAYDPAPVPGISLYGSLIEDGATPTRFTSSSAVLSRLPASLVERLRDMRAAHACFLYRLDHPEQRAQEPEELLSRGDLGWGPDHYWTHHPAIFENEYGVETLFLCLLYTDRLLGVPRTVSDGILEEVYGHLYDPEHVYEHAWQPDDLVVFDNITVQHERPEPNEVARTLRRYHLSETDLTADYLRVGREQGLL
ncbi:MAG: TauD/TfdA family dioxygenase [bacterium]|nr:TauD/TfdA family dioxygenase [bacterium]